MQHLAPYQKFTGLRYLAWLLLRCPRTGEEVVSRITEPLKFADNLASWWPCPACGSWHVNVVEKWQNTGPRLKYAAGLTSET